MQKTNKGLIDDWRLVYTSRGKYVQGRVIGHPVFPDGRFICTSLVVDINITHTEVETENSLYFLGVPGDY